MNIFTHTIFIKLKIVANALLKNNTSHLKIAALLFPFLLALSMSLFPYENQKPSGKDYSELQTFGPRGSKPISQIEAKSEDERMLATKIIKKQKNRIKKKGKRYHKLVVQTATRYGIDPALIKAIIMAESGYNHKAESKKGAIGLMQIMPVTADSLGITDGFDPEENINGGVRYFKQLLDRFEGDIKLALAAYNAGSGHVERYGGVPPFKATRIYIWKVFEYLKIYKDDMEEEPGVA